MSFTFRHYEASDRQTCLDVFQSNVPRFFAEAERAEYAEFLEGDVFEEDYYVIEERGKILGCGGVYLHEGWGGMVWGMVARTQHRRGAGRFLLLKRLEHLYLNYPAVLGVRLDTSQHSQGFFARFGFVVEKTTPDSYAPGLDRYDMTLSGEALADLFRAGPLFAGENVEPGSV